MSANKFKASENGDFLLAGGRYCDSVLPVILITATPTEVIVKLN